MREVPHPGRCRRVVWRSGKTAANLIHGNDEIFVGIERVTLADIHLLDDLVGAGVPSGNENGVILGGIKRAVSSVGECAIANGAALFQIEITDVVQLVRTM